MQNQFSGTKKSLNYFSYKLLMGCIKSIQNKQQRISKIKPQQQPIEPLFIRIKINQQAETIRQPAIKRICQQQIQKIKQIYSECFKEYQLHRIDKAYYKAEKLKHTILNSEVDNHETYRQQLHQIWKLIAKIFRQYEQVITFNKEVLKSGWTEKSNKNGIKVSTRISQQDNVGCSLIQTEIDMPFDVLLQIVYEFQLYGEYTPYVEMTRTQKYIARNCKIGHTVNKFPILAQRETFFYAMGYDRLDETGQLFMYTSALNNKQHLHKQFDYYPVQRQGAVPINYKYFILKYHPINQTKGRVTIAFSIDMQFIIIPTFIIQRLNINYAQDFIANINKIGQNYKGSKWQQLYDQKSPQQKQQGIYGTFGKAVSTYLQNKSKSPQKVLS